MTRELSLLAALGLLLTGLALAAPAFFQPANLRDLLLANASVLIAATGMTMVILIRQIDVSIGAQFAACAIAFGLLAKTGIPLPFAALATLAVGSFLGFAIGLLAGPARLPSIVVTLAAMAILRDALRWTTGGAWIQGLPPNFQWLGLPQPAAEAAIVLTAAAILAAHAWTLRNLAAGRALYATGSDAEAARLAAIDPPAVTLAVFTLMGALAAVAALIDSVRFSEIQTNSGVGFELKVIAAVVVGGTSVNGGRGTLLGTLLGVAILGIVGPALTFLGVNAFWEKAIQGLIILLAVTLDAVRNRKHHAV